MDLWLFSEKFGDLSPSFEYLYTEGLIAAVFYCKPRLFN